MTTMQTNIIHCGECAEVMQGQIQDDSIDLTVTSPPYDNLRDYNGYVFEFEKIARELWRVTKPGGVVVWVVADATINGSETGTSFRQALYFMGIGFNLHDTMIYKKDALQFPDANRYGQVFEYMFIFSKSIPKTMNFINDKRNISYGRKVTGTNRQRNGEVKQVSCIGQDIKELGRRFNVWEIPNTKGNQETRHPAIFPEALARDHIISWSNPGDIVLDPMCGSGTTLKMAVELGRKYIGIDISQEYCNLSQKRVEGARVPLPGLLATEEKKPEAEQLKLNE